MTTTTTSGLIKKNHRKKLNPLYIDTDNAMGSPAGDVDDGFALLHLFLSSQPLIGVGSVFGNTTAVRAHQNNQSLLQLCQRHVPTFCGASRPGESQSEAVPFLLANNQTPFRILALGPLTNVAQALCLNPDVAKNISDMILVGSTLHTKGRWPPFWPFEFNLTKDKPATQVVFESSIPLTVVPLDVARQFKVTPKEWPQLKGPVGDYIRGVSKRWVWRNRWLKATSSFPVWDLLAAVAVTDPDLVEIEERHVARATNGFIAYANQGRPVRVVRSFHRDQIWDCFLELIRKGI